MLRKLADLLQSEVYMVIIMLLKHAGYIRIPEYLDEAYRNPGRTQAAAIERLRWLAPSLVGSLGSYPEETLKLRYNSRRLPRHLEEYSLGVKREEPRVRGERDIGQRMPQNVKVKLTTSVKQNLSKKDLRMKLSVRTKTPPAEEEKEEVTIEVEQQVETNTAENEIDDTPEAPPKIEGEKIDANQACYYSSDIWTQKWDERKALI